MKGIYDNVVSQSRGSRGLFIWTDCDREGEHIGSEIERAARKGNAQIQVKRARFNNLERAYFRGLIMLTVDILFMRHNILSNWIIDKLLQ
jgi:DNA topoisomerase III